MKTLFTLLIFCSYLPAFSVLAAPPKRVQMIIGNIGVYFHIDNYQLTLEEYDGHMYQKFSIMDNDIYIREIWLEDNFSNVGPLIATNIIKAGIVHATSILENTKQQIIVELEVEFLSQKYLARAILRKHQFIVNENNTLRRESVLASLRAFAICLSDKDGYYCLPIDATTP